jgi:hypothetical protein
MEVGSLYSDQHLSFSLTLFFLLNEIGSSMIGWYWRWVCPGTRHIFDLFFCQVTTVMKFQQLTPPSTDLMIFSLLIFFFFVESELG